MSTALFTEDQKAALAVGWYSDSRAGQLKGGIARQAEGEASSLKLKSGSSRRNRRVRARSNACMVPFRHGPERSQCAHTRDVSPHRAPAADKGRRNA
jgi:hypothetical protein